MAPTLIYDEVEIVKGKMCGITSPSRIVQHSCVRAYELFQQFNVLQRQRLYIKPFYRERIQCQKSKSHSVCTNLVMDDNVWITANRTGVSTYLLSSLLQQKNVC